MSKDSKKELEKIIALLEEAMKVIEEIKKEEDDYYEGLSKELKEGFTGQKIKKEVGNLSDAFDCLNNTVSFIYHSV